MTTKYHIDATMALSSSSAQADDSVMISRAYQEKKKLNGKMLMSIIQIIQFLGRQGLAFRGHEDCESNFMQLMKPRSHDEKVNI